MTRREDWWVVEEPTFSSSAPVVGRLIAKLRGLWNSVATRWYVLSVLEQQNSVNLQLVRDIERLREELTVVQGIQVDLDREQQEMNRIHSGTEYAIRDEVQRLRQKVRHLEPPVKRGPEEV